MSAPTLRGLFCAEASLAAHQTNQTEHRSTYIGTVIALARRGVQISNGTKARVLAAAWARRDWELAELFVEKALDPRSSVAVVYKAVKLLDAPREAAAIEKRLLRDAKQLERTSAGRKIRPSKLRRLRRAADLLRSRVHDLRAEPVVGSTSLSAGVSKQIRCLLKSLPTEAFSAVGREHVWRHIMDLCHVRPDVLPVQGFAAQLFDGADSAAAPGGLCADGLIGAIRQGVKYDKIRAVLPELVAAGLSQEAMEALADTAELDTLLWWYETELHHPVIEKAIHRKLSSGEVPQLPYGKLVERIVAFSQVQDSGPRTVEQALAELGLTEQELPWEVMAGIREQVQATAALAQPALPGFLPELVHVAGVRQKDIALPLRTPVLVAGDKSASMQVCVMSASIIASILTGLAEAELVFFNHEREVPAIQPKDAASAVSLSQQVQAVGQTANAVALVEAYETKKLYNTIVMVSDEEENTSALLSTGERILFAELFKRYRDLVAPEVKLVLVSFVADAIGETQLAKELAERGIGNEVVSQFKFSQQRPDLTKLDSMIGLMSCDTADFVEEANAVAEKIKQGGVSAWRAAETAVLEERAQRVKRRRIDELVAQLAKMAPSETIHQMVEKAVAGNSSAGWELLSDAGSLADWEVNSTDSELASRLKLLDHD